ncbi:MAG: DUF4844 domain-containing protein, partial [Tannerellaceae bacterium]|nr:DUF4844 domain-containing protein [Tannerellaceae bacterium]
ISTLLQMDITPLLIEWYSIKTEQAPLPLHQLAKISIDYLQIMKEAGVIKERQRKELEKIINNDIDIFWNNNDSTLLIHTIHSSLAKIGDHLYGTEDREFFTSFYYQLALTKNMDIGKELNEWLYGPWVNEIEEKVKLLPWE